MPRRKNNNQNKPEGCPNEDFRIKIDLIFKEFLSSCDTLEYDFPSTLTNFERKYVHEKCRFHRLQSKSHGKEPNRILTIYKKNKVDAIYENEIIFSPQSEKLLNDMFKKKPDLCFNYVTKTNITDKSLICKPHENNLAPVSVAKADSKCFASFRKQLPISKVRRKFLNLLKENQVVIVSAETGSGKTTQIPQYILEESTELSKPCRIICTQPHRISTVAVAERVALERGESIGNTVGYQIRLESKCSKKTALLYCTNGVLLKLLNTKVSGITHIIVDEIHERDKYSDFLLICLKQYLSNYPNLRLILMSASVDTALFENYFSNSKVLLVKGRLFPIKQLFLDDILPLINYENKDMKVAKKLRLGQQTQSSDGKSIEEKGICAADIPEMNSLINESIASGSDDAFAQIMQMILSENVNVDYREPTKGYTPLIAAIVKNKISVLEQLINLGANVNLTTYDGLTPIHYANQSNNSEIKNFLSAFTSYSSRNENPAEGDANENKNILMDYDKTVDENRIDFILIKELILYIHNKVDNLGGILVFLPGHEDILKCYDIIASLNILNVKIFLLHGSMQIGAQHEVFCSLKNKQKIILATNVAETSITIDDICFVIDSGKSKEKSYDAFSGIFSLEKQWISKACVKQRSGRAGRTKPGISFHIFSRNRFESMTLSTTPEILRVPLQELCLHSKLFMPNNMKIAEFISLAIQPPSSVAVQKAISSLKNLDALYENENLTRLGQCLVQISLEPYLGKILLYSVLFKCVDPVLTLVASLSQKDPFILPQGYDQKVEAAIKRKTLSCGTHSDHMSLLKVYQLWETKSYRSKHLFCQEHFINSSCLATITQTKEQLKHQLCKLGFKIENINSSKWHVIKACLLTGLYPNIAFFENSKLRTRNEKKVIIHPSSCLRKQALNKSLWYMYEELTKVGTYCSIRNVTPVTSSAVALICGKVTEFSLENEITIDSAIEFNFSNTNFLYLRSSVDKLVVNFIQNPSYFSRDNNLLLTKITEFLTYEETFLNLPQPVELVQMETFTKEYSDNREVVAKNFSNKKELNYPTNDKFWEDTCFLIIKNNVLSNMMSNSENNWKFSFTTGKKILSLHKANKKVILIFFAKGSSFFQGAALLTDINKKTEYFGCIKWLTKKTIFSGDVKKEVQVQLHTLTDGQEIPYLEGKKLCDVFCSKL